MSLSAVVVLYDNHSKKLQVFYIMIPMSIYPEVTLSELAQGMKFKLLQLDLYGLV